MVPCEVLWKNEKELKKYSIYLLDDDLKDRDFEFFIFIDPDNPKDRPPFLKELFNIIENYKSNGREFALPEHRKELKKWIGAKNEKDYDLTPLNWLKIAIEQYPYRLIVVTNQTITELPEFIRKRICFIKSEEFYELFKTGNYLINIFFIWLYHLNRSLLDGKINCLVIYFHKGEEHLDRLYIPGSLPNMYIFQGEKSKKNNPSSAKKGDANYEKIIKICFDKKEISEVTDLNGCKNCWNLFLSRHDNFYFIDLDNNVGMLDNNLGNQIKSNLIYAEAYSGSLSYFNLITSAMDNNNDMSKLFMLRYIENAILLIGICDERFQEWWAKKGNNKAGSIFQMGVTPVFINNYKLYGQYNIGKDNFYYSFRYKNKKGSLNVVYPKLNSKDKSLWLQKRKRNIIDLLIIHQGILDEWKKQNKESNKLTRIILELKDFFPFIVITSGRGKPDNLPKGVKFLPFSNIESCMSGDYFEKITLLRQLIKNH
jgi:hypothetical protein